MASSRRHGRPDPEMPGGIRLFLVYAFLILAGIGIALPYVP